MCGITREVGAGPLPPGLSRELRDHLVHRGPEAAGEHVEERVYLGVRRVRIVASATRDGAAGEIFNVGTRARP